MKNNGAKLFIKTPPEPKEVKLHKSTREKRSQRIWKFLETHEAIKIRPLAEKVGYNPSNFDKYKSGKKILPQHLLLKTEAVLKEYGLNV